MAVEGQKSFTKELFIPSDSPVGTYMMGVEVMYATTVATASQMFSLTQPREQLAKTAQTANKNMHVILLLTAAVLAILIGMAVIFRGAERAEILPQGLTRHPDISERYCAADFGAKGLYIS